MRLTGCVLGEGTFDDGGQSHEPSGAATPVEGDGLPDAKRKKKSGMSKKAKTNAQRLAIIDGEV